jgi:NADPH-dependent curcumin reductase CurA
MRDLVNRRVVLAARPRGMPAPDDFRLVNEPVKAPADGEVLLRTLYLSLDPYMRNLMDEVGPGYAPRVELGAPMVGGTVSRVVASRHRDFREGDLVLAGAGWQDYAVSDGSGLTVLDAMDPPSHALSGLGMPGFTAHVGLMDIGQPRKGETVVVAAATGAVGSMVGQLARHAGARVVGIAGGPEKCAHAVDALGFDACIDRHDPQLPAKLAAVCPRGIDVYFENVGGAVLQAVLPLLNIGARVPVCGFIAHYNEASAPAGGDHLPALLAAVLQKRVRLQGFIILDHYGERFEAFQARMRALVGEGAIRIDEEVVAGLENAPRAFIDMLRGRHLGKVVVAVAPLSPERTAFREPASGSSR